MKTLTLILCLLVGSVQFAVAGGNSSLVDLDKVKSIKIEKGKITIVGDGLVRKRVFTNEENGDTTIFGQPAQWQFTKVRDCTFEIVPYDTRADVAGVPGGGPDKVTPDRKKRNDLHFAGLVATAKTIKAGDAITIGYQRDRAIVLGYKITHIVGEGALRKKTKAK